MASIVQGNLPVQQFYQKVYAHLSLILNKISCLDVGEEDSRILTTAYRNKALDTFVRGLNGDLPILLGIKEPRDLPEALYLCEKLENQNLRLGGKIANTFNPPVHNRNTNDHRN